MIYDKIENWETYAGVSEGIQEGLAYLKQMSPEVAVGVYEISPRAKAIVSEYTTKLVNENGYEAHREYIDIQYLLFGEELLASAPLEYLKETKPYSKDCDAAFFAEGEAAPQHLPLGNGYFAILFPQDGHMPQLALNEPVAVKKVVVKVKI